MYGAWIDLEEIFYLRPMKFYIRVTVTSACISGQDIEIRRKKKVTE